MAFQGKKLSVFVANDKIQALKQKFDFWEFCICCCDFHGFPIFKGVSNEISGDINNIYLPDIIQ